MLVIYDSYDIEVQAFSFSSILAKYIKTLQKIYPHLPLNELSETSLATTVPQQPSSSRVGDEAQQLIEMEEDGEELLIKDEPLSPGLEEEEEEREPDEGEGPSTSMGGRGRIERAVPVMRKMWMVNTSGATSLSQEEEEEDEENDAEYDRAGMAS